jgi:uncharacterized protein (UPF0335 family)
MTSMPSKKPATVAEHLIGHNSIDKPNLKQLVERIEAVESEIADLNEDKKAIFGEATAAGFDAKALRQIIKLRKLDKNEREARQALIDEYMSPLQGLADLPLGRDAMARAGLTPPV